MIVSGCPKICEPHFMVDIEISNSHTYQLDNGCVTHNTTSCILGTASGIH